MPTTTTGGGVEWLSRPAVTGISAGRGSCSAPRLTASQHGRGSGRCCVCRASRFGAAAFANRPLSATPPDGRFVLQSSGEGGNRTLRQRFRDVYRDCGPSPGKRARRLPELATYNRGQPHATTASTTVMAAPCPLRLREGDGVVNGRECLVRSVHGDESPETRVLHVAQPNRRGPFCHIELRS